VSKCTWELRALEPGPGSANRGPAGAAGAKCCGSSAGEANAGTVLIEESAATLTQFLLARLVLQSGKEAKGPLVSQEVQEAHKFAVEAAGCRHNQGEKGLVVMTEAIRAIPVALRLRHGRVDEHLVRVGVARLTVTGGVRDTAVKVVDDGDVDDEIRRPGHVQALNLQVPASLAAAVRDATAAVGAKARVMHNVSDCREEKLVTCQPMA
jgi:hypothetical protein